MVLSDGNNCSHYSDKTSVESVSRQQLAVEYTTYLKGLSLFLHFLGGVFLTDCDFHSYFRSNKLKDPF